MFVIEKRSHDKIEGYISDISETRQKKVKRRWQKKLKGGTHEVFWDDIPNTKWKWELRSVCFCKEWELYVSHQRKEKDLHNLKLMVLAVLYQTGYRVTRKKLN